MVPAERMAEIIRAAGGDLKRANQSLIEAANGAGGADNITSVLVQVHA
jgi:protein phosphatase